MTRKTVLVALAILVIGIVVGSVVTILADSRRTYMLVPYPRTWDYLSTECPTSTVPLAGSAVAPTGPVLLMTAEDTCQDMLNILGGEGWELVSVVVSDTTYFFLKRPS